MLVFQKILRIYQMNEPLLPCLKVSIKYKSNLLNIYQINKVMETMSEAHPEPCQTKIHK